MRSAYVCTFLNWKKKRNRFVTCYSLDFICYFWNLLQNIKHFIDIICKLALIFWSFDEVILFIQVQYLTTNIKEAIYQFFPFVWQTFRIILFISFIFNITGSFWISHLCLIYIDANLRHSLFLIAKLANYQRYTKEICIIFNYSSIHNLT